jgi:probable phosphoglycerate mutase
MIIDLIRHGEPLGGRGYRGHGVDDPLSETGWRQMRDALADGSGWSRIVSSPLKRCSAFADELAVVHDLRVSIEDRFREVGFGRWEGLSPDEVIARWPEEYSAFYEDPVNFRPEGAESLQAFYQRVSDGLDALVSHPDEHILLIAHAGVIRAAITKAAGAAPGTMYRYKIPYAGITRLRFDGQGWFIEFVNARP